MKLVLVTNASRTMREGGYNRKRMTAYAARVEELHICRPGRSSSVERIADNAWLHTFASPRPLRPFILYAKLVALLRRLGPGTVVSSQDPFMLGQVARAAGRKAGVPLHVQVHVDYYNRAFRSERLSRRLLVPAAESVLNAAARIRVVSEKIATYCHLAFGVPADRIDTIPVSIDLQRFRDDPAAHADPEATMMMRNLPFTHRILITSRLTAVKNLPLAITMFQQVKAVLPGAGLVIAGAGDRKGELVALLREQGLEESVKLIPWTDNVPALMRAADVFVMSSNYEGYGMTVVEASASGLPVVMTNVGAAGEFILNDVNGLIVPVSDAAALARAVIRILTEPDLAARLAQGGLEQAAKLPSFEDYCDRLVASWQATLAE